MCSASHQTVLCLHGQQDAMSEAVGECACVPLADVSRLTHAAVAEGSAVMCYGVSLAYKESANCRLRAISSARNHPLTELWWEQAGWRLTVSRQTVAGHQMRLV